MKQGTMESFEPVTSIWDSILLLSLNGTVDSSRAQSIMDSVLKKIGSTSSKILILDVTGVAAIDTAVANHLIKVTQAAELMGCKCIISGISPTIAQSLVELGIPLSDIATRATISDALAYGFDKLELEVVSIGT